MLLNQPTNGNLFAFRQNITSRKFLVQLGHNAAKRGHKRDSVQPIENRSSERYNESIPSEDRALPGRNSSASEILERRRGSECNGILGATSYALQAQSKSCRPRIEGGSLKELAQEFSVYAGPIQWQLPVINLGSRL